MALCYGVIDRASAVSDCQSTWTPDRGRKELFQRDSLQHRTMACLGPRPGNRGRLAYLVRRALPARSCRCPARCRLPPGHAAPPPVAPGAHGHERRLAPGERRRAGAHGVRLAARGNAPHPGAAAGPGARRAALAHPVQPLGAQRGHRPVVDPAGRHQRDDRRGRRRRRPGTRPAGSGRPAGRRRTSGAAGDHRREPAGPLPPPGRRRAVRLRPGPAPGAR